MHVWVRPLLYHERAEYPGRVAAAGRMQRERGIFFKVFLLLIPQQRCEHTAARVHMMAENKRLVVGKGRAVGAVQKRRAQHVPRPVGQMVQIINVVRPLGHRRIDVPSATCQPGRHGRIIPAQRLKVHRASMGGHFRPVCARRALTGSRHGRLLHFPRQLRRTGRVAVHAPQPPPGKSRQGQQRRQNGPEQHTVRTFSARHRTAPFSAVERRAAAHFGILS